MLKKGPRCSVRIVLDSLSDEDRVALEAALEDRRFSSRFLRETLQEEGHMFARQTIDRHRNHDCACSRYVSRETS